MASASPRLHLEATAALLERAYRLALELDDTDEADDTAHAAFARELVSVLDDARASLLHAASVRGPRA